MSLPLTDSEGRIYVTPAGNPVSWNAGLGYDNLGRLCITTTLNPNDDYVGGKRVADDGSLVVGNGTPPARPYKYNSGLPQDNRNGAMIRQVDVVPAPTDPFVAGVRVGPLGGVYMTLAVIP